MRCDIRHLKRSPGTSKMALSGRPLFLHTFLAFFIHFHFFLFFFQAPNKNVFFGFAHECSWIQFTRSFAFFRAVRSRARRAKRAWLVRALGAALATLGARSVPRLNRQFRSRDTCPLRCSAGAQCCCCTKSWLRQLKSQRQLRRRRP